MATVTVDDPYKTLGVPKDATIAAIKSAYRKLVLTCHPDKVIDETLKAKKADEFHKIQMAYELVGDEEARQQHDAESKLAALRKEKMERDARSGGYAKANTASYRSPRSAAVFEERRPTFSAEPAYFDEPLRGSSRKADDYSSSRRTPPRSKTEQYSERERERARRSERERARDQEARRERDFKNSYHEQDLYEERRRERDAETVKPEPYKSGSIDSELNQKMEQARKHIQSSTTRPSSHRSGSSQTFDSPRRSRAPPKESSRSARRSDSAERYPDRRPPTLESHRSSPAKMEIPLGRARSPPRRAFTLQPDHEYRSTDELPHPGLRRAETAPSGGFMTATPRKRDTNPAQPSRLRTSTTAAAQDSGYSSNSGPGSPEASYGFHSEIPPPQSKASSTRYKYSDEKDDSGKYKYEIRVPGRSSQESTSPPRDRVRESERPSLSSYGSSRSARYSFAGPSSGDSRRPSVVRSPSSTATPIPRAMRSSESRSDRERDYFYERDLDNDRASSKMFYGEVPSARGKDSSASYSPDKVFTRRTYRPEDINYSKDWYGQKPSLERGHTFHYAKTPV